MISEMRRWVRWRLDGRPEPATEDDFIKDFIRHMMKNIASPAQPVQMGFTIHCTAEQLNAIRFVNISNWGSGPYGDA